MLKLLKIPLDNQRGVTDSISLLIILPLFLCVTFMVVTFFTFTMRQAKLDDIKDRALQMVQTSGYLTPEIINDTTTKLSEVGFPPVSKGGITFPVFTGSTTTKVLKDASNPTVKLVIQYPALELDKLMAFFGVSSTEDAGYYYLEGIGRSERYE